MSVRSGNSGRKKKLAKTSLCKEAAEVLKAIFHIQDQEHKTIIRDESKIKTNEVEKKRSGKWIKTRNH